MPAVNLPNSITLTRIFSIPLLIWLLSTNHFHNFNGEQELLASALFIAASITEPANWRATRSLDNWLKSNGLVGIAGIDTRRLTRRLRDGGASNAAIVHAPDAKIDGVCATSTAASLPSRRGESDCRGIGAAGHRLPSRNSLVGRLTRPAGSGINKNKA